jgi:hypothetical protein
MPIRERVHEPAVLTSWKEIAAYLGKGVRTVQRWEKGDRLPVRRIAGTSKIVAHRDELDLWLRAQPSLHPRPGVPVHSRLDFQSLHENMRISDELRRSTTTLLDSVRSQMQRLIDGCRQIAAECATPVGAISHRDRPTVPPTKMSTEAPLRLARRIS